MTYSQEDVLHELREIRDDYLAALKSAQTYMVPKTQRRLDVINGLIKEKVAQLIGPRIDEVTP